MLFPTPLQLSEGTRFRDFKIIVYKIGKKIGKFNDPNEILIGLKSSYKDPDLGKADLVGLPTLDIIKKFGSPDMKKNDLIIYHHLGNILILKTNEGKIKWFKYLRLNREVTSSKLEELVFKIKDF